MTNPLHITFKGIRRSGALDRWIHEWASKLERAHPRIVGCDVTVEEPHRHHRRGRQYHVKIRLALPGGDLVVSRDPGLDGAHEDPYIAVRDAFRAARRQLEDRVHIAHDVRA